MISLLLQGAMVSSTQGIEPVVSGVVFQVGIDEHDGAGPATAAALAGRARDGAPAAAVDIRLRDTPHRQSQREAHLRHAKTCCARGASRFRRAPDITPCAMVLQWRAPRPSCLSDMEIRRVNPRLLRSTTREQRPGRARARSASSMHHCTKDQHRKSSPYDSAPAGLLPSLGLPRGGGAIRGMGGNGPFGWGFSLSLPAVTRKTDKGLPKYRRRCRAKNDCSRVCRGGP
jgi:hypothetical protein